MGSSLAEEFWARFAVLLVAVFGVVVVLTAACDTLAVRILSRRLPPRLWPSAKTAPERVSRVEDDDGPTARLGPGHVGP
ncbi:hypothetical protein [Streptomyces sp. NPDC050538]|uniref:hypothetical protein n=1 Tax=Streptomyces sp. NPDC050538 TaxID=3365627 RepID=UPI0037A9347E